MNWLRALSTALAPATWLLAAWCLANLVLDLLATTGLVRCIEPALEFFAWVVTHQQQIEGDSWHHMIPLYQQASTDDGATVYTEVFFDRQIMATYPPTALLVFPPLEALGIDDHGWPRALFAISCVSLLAFIVALDGIVRAGLTQVAGLPQHIRLADRVVIFASCAIASVTYFPLMESLLDGQAQLWISALIALGVWHWVAGHKAWAGVFIALAATFKPHYGLFLVWGILRRQWSFVAALGGTCGAALALAVSQFGLACHLNYLDVWRFMVRHGEASHAWNNQSLSGTLHWLYGIEKAPGLEHWWPPYHAGIHTASLAFGAAILLAALWIPARGRAAGDALDLATMAISITLASPIAWRHHYGVLLPLFALCYTRLVAANEFQGRHLLLLAGSYLAMRTAWHFPEAFEASYLEILNATMFLGGLLLLAQMYTMHRLEPPAYQGPAQPSPSAPAGAEAA